MNNLDIYVYYGDVRALSDELLFQHYEQQQSSTRRMKIQKQKTIEGKRLSLGAGILLQKIQKVNGIDPQANPKCGIHGKPYFSDFPDLSFNLSHSGTKVMACWVCAKGVQAGCDVERIEPKVELMDAVIERFYSLREQEELRIMDPEEKKKRFYRIWTLKESVLKAQGSGITRPLKTFSVLLPGDAVQAKTPKVIFHQEEREKNGRSDFVKTAEVFTDQADNLEYALKEWQFSQDACWSLCLTIDPRMCLCPGLNYHVQEVRF